MYQYCKSHWLIIDCSCLSGFFFCINFDLLSRWQDIGTNHQSTPRKWRKIRTLTYLRLRQAETEMGQFSTSHQWGRCMHWWSLMSFIYQCISLCKYSKHHSWSLPRSHSLPDAPETSKSWWPRLWKFISIVDCLPYADTDNDDKDCRHNPSARLVYWTLCMCNVYYI